MSARGVGDSEFSYRFYDLYTMEPLGSMPINKATYTKKLNGAGSFQGSVYLEDPRLQNLGIANMCHPGRTAMFIDVDGTLDWGGVIWTRNYQRSTRTLTLGGSELWSYIYSRVQAADYSTSWIGPADPMQIAKTIVQDALAVANSALADMTVAIQGATSTTEWVSMSFPYIQLQTVGMIVTMMQQMGYTIGYDFAVDVSYDAYWNPMYQLTLSNPRRGRVAGKTGLMVDVSQCVDWTYPEDASRTGNKLYETSTAAASMLDIEVADGPLQSGYPLLEQLVEHPNINSVPTGNLQEVLHAVALGDLAVMAYPAVTPTVTVAIANTSQLQLGDFIVGDDIRFYVPSVAAPTPGATSFDSSLSTDFPAGMDGITTSGAGLCYDPRFPNGLDTYFRIIQQDTTVNDEGLSTFKLTLNVPPSASGQPVPAPLV